MKLKRFYSKGMRKAGTFVKAVVLTAGLMLLPAACAHGQKTDLNKENTRPKPVSEMTGKKAKKRRTSEFSGLVTKGSRFAVKNYNVSVECLNSHEISLLASGPGHNIQFTVPYGVTCTEWPQLGAVKAEEGMQPGTAELEIKPAGIAMAKGKTCRRMCYYEYSLKPSDYGAIRVTSGTIIRKNNEFRVHVLTLNKQGVSLHMLLPKRTLLLQVPYEGKTTAYHWDFSRWKENNLQEISDKKAAADYPRMKATRGCQDGAAWLKFQMNRDDTIRIN